MAFNVAPGIEYTGRILAEVRNARQAMGLISPEAARMIADNWRDAETAPAITAFCDKNAIDEELLEEIDEILDFLREEEKDETAAGVGENAEAISEALQYGTPTENIAMVEELRRYVVAAC